MFKYYFSVLLSGLFFVPILIRAEGGRGFGNGGNESIQKYLRHLYAIRSGRLKSEIPSRTQKLWNEQLSPFGNYHLLEKESYSFLELAQSLKDIPLVEVSDGTKKSLHFQNGTLSIDSTTLKTQESKQLFDEITETIPALYKNLYPQSWALDYYFKHRASLVLSLSAQEPKKLSSPQESYWQCYRAIFADLLSYSPTPTVQEEEEIISYLSKADFSSLSSVAQHPNSRHLMTVRQRVYKKITSLSPFMNAIKNKSPGNIGDTTKKKCPFIKSWEQP